MHIHRLTAFQVPIALKQSVRHASHERTANDTLILRCVLSDGSTGWGEGLPRTYVTGESIDSAWRHLSATSFEPLREQTFASAYEAALAVDRFELSEVPPDAGITVRECFGYAVRCALELSVVDAAARAEQRSVSELIRAIPDVARNAESPHDTVRYSGVVTAATPGRQWLSGLKMRLFGFRQVKVKLGTAGLDDAALLGRIRRMVGAGVDLRGDANEAWHCEQVPSVVVRLRKFHLSSLEQPVPHAEVNGLRDLRKDLGIPVMLDESLCCREDAERAVAGDWCDAFNIRLSKCGGILRSVRLALLARKHGLRFQLGCQVGETGILSAAGRHFACEFPDALFLEGSFDRFLVQDRLTEEDLTFGYGGVAPRLKGPGLGVRVDECRVRQLSVRSMDLIHA